MFESLKIHKGQAFDIEDFNRRLVDIGYTRSQGISETGDFSVRGENVFIYPATFEYPIRIELSDEIIKKIVSIDILTFKSIQEHTAVIILPAKGRVKIKHYYHKKFLRDQDPIDTFVDIEPGDYVVHVDYGIGRFIGTKKMSGKQGEGRSPEEQSDEGEHLPSLKLRGIVPRSRTRKQFDEEEHIVIEYRDKDLLYVPFSDLNKVQKYIYFSSKRPKLYKLGGKGWQRTKERASRGVLKVAEEILEVQAKRESLIGHNFSPDTDWQKLVEEAFPYKETEGQIKATREVKSDMEKPKPMDRLLCGDVGYGKTEVALRAAFKAVMDNKQVAILTPTTILAEQHYATFKNRLKDFPVNIEMLSRFRKKTIQQSIVKELKQSHVDIVIGTHRLLSDDIAFKDLGLVIIDEEQRFGVRHKEKLKKLRLIVDVLTLTATPIPRTLYLALMGGRDISTINTPPLERLPIETSIIEYNEHYLKNVIRKELDRKGQVYFVHNRIDSIDKIATKLKELLPEVKIGVGHGRMRENVLERTMLKFIKGQMEVLVCTTIIESGIDIPNVNTLIVNKAENFGLADLYQLRGRVGRFSRKAYAYFIIDKKNALTHDAQKRLDALKRFTELGSGFKIAMQDLELRGAGNLLGTQQHGYIEQVGFDLYCRLLHSAIEHLKK